MSSTVNAMFNLIETTLGAEDGGSGIVTAGHFRSFSSSQL